MKKNKNKTVRNESGIVGARKARVYDQEVTITHRNPANGQLWAEDYMFRRGDGQKIYGAWFRPEQVKFV